MAKSIIGFHYSIGGNKNGIGEFMKKLNEAGIPFLMKGTDDAGLCFEAQELGKKTGVSNWLIYRVSTAGQNNVTEYDVPDYTQSPQKAAAAHWQKTVAKWPTELDKAVVWMEPINEPRAKASPADVQWENRHPVDWLGEFMLEHAILANAKGYKVCGPSFNSGEPEIFTSNDYELPGMLNYLRYCAANPDKAALSVHEYVWDRAAAGETWVDWYPQLWGRVEAAIAAASKHNIPHTFAIFMTEWGFAARHAPRWPECEPHLTAYNQWAARYPQVKGVAAWSLQSNWGTVDNDLQSWFAPLATYAVSREFTPPGHLPLSSKNGHAAKATNVFRFTHWPTEHQDIMQKYNDNPEHYAPPLTGHDGVDIHAPYGSPIFAVAAGTVEKVRSTATEPKHAYGNSVYIRHTNGYRTAYAHLKEVSVAVGDRVTGGQIVGLAGNTGTVRPSPTEDKPTRGTHLHLTLYKNGATQGGETEQPYDIIDPTPFLDQLKHDKVKPEISQIGLSALTLSHKHTIPQAVPSFQPGVNINPDAHKADIERLRGLHWVRYVYKASARHRNVNQAFEEQYRFLIQGYAEAGIKSLIILNQETEWGNGPWQNDGSGDWETYATYLAQAARRIAELCAPFSHRVAYQIWNEEDSGPENISAIGIAPEKFALVLAKTADAIRQVSPQATIVLGGLNTGPANGIAYLQQVQRQLNGKLPVNALAVHPYGRYVEVDYFHGGRFGKLQDSLRAFKQAFPQFPLWITEIGVANNTPIGPEHYEKIANYMREIVTEVANNHSDYVPVLIWFAWSDMMRNAGIIDADNKMKPLIDKAFHEMVARGRKTAAASASPVLIP